MPITWEEASAPIHDEVTLACCCAQQTWCLYVRVQDESSPQRRLLGLSAQRKHEGKAVGGGGGAFYVGMHEKIWKQAANTPVGLCVEDD